MTADVQEGVDLALGVAYDQDRVLTHVGAEEVPRLRDLAFVAEEQPAARKDPLQLLFVDLPLDEDASADQSVIGIDEITDVCHHGTLLTRLHDPSPCARDALALDLGPGFGGHELGPASPAD